MGILAIATLVTYLQVFRLGFLNYDTPVYVNLNSRVLSGITINNIQWALSTTYFSNWHPITWLSHMLDVEIWGLNPAGHHATNLFFHIVNSLLLYLLLNKLSGSVLKSALVAGLFALHPLHIESVAWIAERKDLLATFFALLSLLSYYRYTQRLSLVNYFPVLIFFVIGLMAKPMIITLPALLLLLDFWPLARFSRSNLTIQYNSTLPGEGRASLASILMEKIPLLLISLISAFITIAAQQTSMASTDALPISMRLANAITAYAGYIFKTLWPKNLAIIYPHPGMPEMAQLIPSILLLVLLTSLSIWWVKTRPWFGTSWLWFLGTLFPVIGIVHVGHQAMADRYSYVPLIGLFIMIAWGLGDIFKKIGKENATYVAVSIPLLFVLSITTQHQLQYWQNDESLFSRALEVTGPNYIAESNLGYFYLQNNNLQEAANHSQRAIEINPYHDISYLNLGITLSRMGDSQQAINLYQKALAINPVFSLAEHNLARELNKTGQTEQAIRHYHRAIDLNPILYNSYLNLADIYLKIGETGNALNLLRKLQKIAPNNKKTVQKILEIEELQLQ